MAIGDPNAGMVPMLQYRPDGTPILQINTANPPVSSPPIQPPPATPLAPPPALSKTNAPTTAGALSPQQGRRANTMLSVKRPDLGIGTNEMLMRVGGAGLANAGQGGLAAYGAMFDQYGNIQDQRRTNALAEYEADYGAQQDELARQDALKIAQLEAQSKNAVDADTQQQIGQIDQSIFDMDRALANLEGGMQLTGFFDATLGAAWDNFKGNPEAAGRLLLQKLKVDDTLLRVAQTKGAISNKEMDLFMSPAPSNFSDEKVWIAWIRERKQAIKQVRARLASGQTVNQDQQATQGQVNQFSSGNTSGGNQSAADAIVGLSS